MCYLQSRRRSASIHLHIQHTADRIVLQIRATHIEQSQRGPFSTMPRTKEAGRKQFKQGQQKHGKSSAGNKSNQQKKSSKAAPALPAKAIQKNTERKFSAAKALVHGSGLNSSGLASLLSDAVGCLEEYNIKVKDVKVATKSPSASQRQQAQGMDTADPAVMAAAPAMQQQETARASVPAIQHAKANDVLDSLTSFNL